MSKNIPRPINWKPLYRLFLLKNDEKYSVKIAEVEEIDITEIRNHLKQGESIFISPQYFSI